MKETTTIIEEWPKEVTNWKTSDGELFQTKEKADNHQEKIKEENARRDRAEEARKWLVRNINDKTKFKVQGKVTSFVNAVADVLSLATPAEMAPFLKKPVIAVLPSENSSKEEEAKEKQS